MATIRQPFAQLDGLRLQNLTSLKNRQNATASPSSVKRKASETVDNDDSENVDPVLFSKRLKGSNDSSSKDLFIKPSNFILTKSASTNDISSPLKLSSPRPRSVLNPRSPAARLNAGIVKSSPLSAPAGRSPTRGKKAGLLSSSKRRTAGSYSRVDPPAFGLSAKSAAPFSLDAALKGTLSSYASRDSSSAISASPSISQGLNELHEGDLKSSWFFEIHEDTAEQEMTNLLQHSTCVLDISSDEETETRRQRERAEGKENVPPVDDVSQTSRPRAARQAAETDAMVFEKERSPLGEMNVRDYFSEGCDENSVIIVPGDDEDEAAQQQQPEAAFVPILEDASASDEPVLEQPSVAAEEPVPTVVEESIIEEQGIKSAEELMGKTEDPAPCAALLEPIEGTGESFDLWESGSAKDETEKIVEC
ncbi:hypothetical protein Micbo1qcDRAFT_55283 [Microdochium bolleyi]|uniref:Thymidylate kinase n=1 Tax=Microdochium bolleyi TaxID=196109 RepID=A0A136J8D4_9PEZI|nr:hypothetical protein Micbo1qcDRAFT_55283 [Microdochium bolleyi]